MNQLKVKRSIGANILRYPEMFSLWDEDKFLNFEMNTLWIII